MRRGLALRWLALMVIAAAVSGVVVAALLLGRVAR
jgi:hypothetical protein